MPQGVIATGDKIFTVKDKTYAAGTVTLAAKTGYVLDRDSLDVAQDTTITATLDDKNHYAFKSGDGYTLATAENTKDYPDLVQVYQLTLPTGVTATGDKIFTVKDKTYAAGTVTLAAKTGYVLDRDSLDVTQDTTFTAPIYQTNDVAAATLKIWDTSGSKQAVISSTNLKKLFHDDNDDAFTDILQAKTNYLVDISKGNTPENNPFGTQLTFTGNNKS